MFLQTACLVVRLYVTSDSYFSMLLGISPRFYLKNKLGLVTIAGTLTTTDSVVSLFLYLPSKLPNVTPLSCSLH